MATSDPDRHTMGAGALDVTVAAAGAQLSSLRHRIFGELLWQAGPVWPQHAPNLFPIVGQLAGDRLLVDGRSYPLKRHGFARDRTFDWIERTAHSCRLVLRDDAQTREIFPFAFALEIAYTVADDRLTVAFEIRNPGARTLPASAGAHPAFRWPLVAGSAKDAHELEFARTEPAPIRRLEAGLLALERFPSPVQGRTLPLSDDLFVADAIVMDEIVSRSVRYRGPGEPALDIAWTGFAQLGIWSKPGAHFLCIEPWRGYASPVDFDGPFETKPGLLLIAPGASETLSFSVAVVARDIA